MNPAPTLLDEWTTNAAFWWFILIAATTGVVWLTVLFITVGRAQDAEDEQGPPTIPDTCAIDGCTNPAATSFYSPTGRLYVCRDCSGRVSEWAGPAIDQDEAS